MRMTLSILAIAALAFVTPNSQAQAKDRDAAAIITGIGIAAGIAAAASRHHRHEHHRHHTRGGRHRAGGAFSPDGRRMCYPRLRVCYQADGHEIATGLTREYFGRRW
jgi:hypothetical protein